MCYKIKIKIVKIISFILAICVMCSALPYETYASGQAKSSSICLASLNPTGSDRYTGNQGDSCVFDLDKTGLPGIYDKYCGYGNVGVDGTVYENGYEVWLARWNFEKEISYASITYDLGGNYSQLSGKTSLIKSYNTTNFNTTLYFYGDGELLYSQVLTNQSYKHEFTIDVSGVNSFKILMKDNVGVKGGTSFALYDMFLYEESSDEEIVTLFPESGSECSAEENVIDIELSVDGELSLNDSQEGQMTILIKNPRESATNTISVADLTYKNGAYYYYDKNNENFPRIDYYITDNRLKMSLYTHLKGTVTVSFKGFICVNGQPYNSINEWNFEIIRDMNYGFSVLNVGDKKMTLELVQRLFGETAKASEIYEEYKDGGGDCYGMALAASSMTYHDFLSIKDFGRSDELWNLSNKSRNDVEDITLEEFFQVCQVAQDIPEIKDNEMKNICYLPDLDATLNLKKVWQYLKACFLNKDKNREKFMSAVKTSIETNTNPVIIQLMGINNNSGSHALWVYDYEENDEQIVLSVYDCNYPGAAKTLILNKENGELTDEWFYNKKYNSTKQNHALTFNQPFEIFKKTYLEKNALNGVVLLKLTNTDIEIAMNKNIVPLGNKYATTGESLSRDDLYWVNEGDEAVLFEINENNSSISLYGNNVSVTYDNLNTGNAVLSTNDDDYSISVASDSQSTPEVSYSFYNGDDVTIVNVIADSSTGDFEVSNSGDDIQLCGIEDANIVVYAGKSNDESSLKVVAEKELTGLIEDKDYTISVEDLYQSSLPNTDASDNREIYIVIFGISSLFFVMLLVANRGWRKENL